MVISGKSEGVDTHFNNERVNPPLINETTGNWVEAKKLVENNSLIVSSLEHRKHKRKHEDRDKHKKKKRKKECNY